MYINHINKFTDAQAIQDALDAGTLANPYVAMTSAGTLDWNSLAPTPQVETRIKNTYRVSQAEWESISGNPEEERTYPASYYNHGVLKAEMEDGTELEYQEGSGYFFPVTGAGDYVVYFTLSGDTIWGDEIEASEGLFAGVAGLKSSEIPESINTVGYGAYSSGGLEAVVFPQHAMTIENAVFGGCYLTGATIPADSVLSGYSFADIGQLEEVTFGRGVTIEVLQEGEGGAFMECPSLASITFLGTTPPHIGAETFPWENRLQIHVPVGSEQAYATSFGTDTGMSFQVAGTGLIEVDPSPSE